MSNLTGAELAISLVGWLLLGALLIFGEQLLIQRSRSRP